jgi:hypothetical protein
MATDATTAPLPKALSPITSAPPFGMRLRYRAILKRIQDFKSSLTGVIGSGQRIAISPASL